MISRNLLWRGGSQRNLLRLLSMSVVRMCTLGVCRAWRAKDRQCEKENATVPCLGH